MTSNTFVAAELTGFFEIFQTCRTLEGCPSVWFHRFSVYHPKSLGSRKARRIAVIRTKDEVKK